MRWQLAADLYELLGLDAASEPLAAGANELPSDEAGSSADSRRCIAPVRQVADTLSITTAVMAAAEDTRVRAGSCALLLAASAEWRRQKALQDATSALHKLLRAEAENGP